MVSVVSVDVPRDWFSVEHGDSCHVADGRRLRAALPSRGSDDDDGGVVDQEEALAVLGLRGPADAATVKRAYRELARRLHPDAGGDAVQFHRVRTAFEVLGDGTDASVGPPPQERVAGVEERWWDAAGVWHDELVDRTGVELGRSLPDEGVTRMDLDLLASLLEGAVPVREVRLRSRAPGSWMHRIIAWLEPDLLAGVHLRPAPDGPRSGHDVQAAIHSSGGRGRRILAGAPTPPGWTRARGSETVRLERRFRPCRDPADTAVRIAREVDAALDVLGWPLGEWFVVRA